MEKTVSIIALITLIFVSVFSVSSTSFAVGEATFTVTAQAEKANNNRAVAKAKEVTLYYGVNDFINLEQYENKGINVFRAVLDYDKNVFEPIEINYDINNDGKKVYKGIATKAGKNGNEDAIQAVGNWSGLTYNPETGLLVIESNSFVDYEDTVLKVILKVKTDAPSGNTSVTLKGIADDKGIQGGNPQGDIYSSNKSVVTVIKVVQQIVILPDSDNENHFFARILAETKVKDLPSSLGSLANNLKNPSGNALGSEDFIPTGSTTTDSGYSYTFITVGDLSADGKLSAVDLSQLKLLSIHDNSIIARLNDNQKRAADLYWDGELTAIDLSQMQNFMVGLSEPEVALWSGEGNPSVEHLIYHNKTVIL